MTIHQGNNATLGAKSSPLIVVVGVERRGNEFLIAAAALFFLALQRHNTELRNHGNFCLKLGY